MPVLKAGSKGGEVKKAQDALNKKGAKPKLKTDGLFGPGTTKAVQEFQKKNKLKADGIVGKNTQAALQGSGEIKTDMTSGKKVSSKKVSSKKVSGKKVSGKKVSGKNVRWPHDDFIKYAKQRRDIDQTIEGLKKDIETAAKAMPDGSEKSAIEKELKDLLAALDKVHVPLIANATGIADKQMEFEKLVAKDPAGAQAIAASVEKDVKQHAKMREAANKPFFALDKLAERVKKSGSGGGSGKSPKWPYGDYKPLLKNCRDDKRDIEKDLKLTLKVAATLPKTKENERAIASLKECWKRFEKAEFENYANVSRVADKQMEFEKLKGKDPAAAEKIIKDVEKDHKDVPVIQKKTRKVFEEMKDKMRAVDALALE
ncbi:MAG: peptidoglycan-binding protein [Planctomycetota bacterium]